MYKRLKRIGNKRFKPLNHVPYSCNGLRFIYRELRRGEIVTVPEKIADIFLTWDVGIEEIK